MLKPLYRNVRYLRVLSSDLFLFTFTFTVSITFWEFCYNILHNFLIETNCSERNKSLHCLSCCSFKWLCLKTADMQTSLAQCCGPNKDVKLWPSNKQKISIIIQIHIDFTESQMEINSKSSLLSELHSRVWLKANWITFIDTNVINRTSVIFLMIHLDSYCLFNGPNLIQQLNQLKSR